MLQILNLVPQLPADFLTEILGLIGYVLSHTLEVLLEVPLNNVPDVLRSEFLTREGLDRVQFWLFYFFMLFCFASAP